MLASTTFDMPGYRIIAHKGMVRGIVVRSPTIAQGILGGLKSIMPMMPWSLMQLNSAQTPLLECATMPPISERISLLLRSSATAPL